MYRGLFYSFFLLLFSNLTAYQMEQISIPLIPEEKIHISNLSEDGKVFGFKYQKNAKGGEFFIWQKDQDTAFYPIPLEMKDHGNCFYQKSIIFNPKNVSGIGEYPFLVISYGLLKDSWQLYFWSPTDGVVRVGHPENFEEGRLYTLLLNDHRDVVVDNIDKDTNLYRISRIANCAIYDQWLNSAVSICTRMNGSGNFICSQMENSSLIFYLVNARSGVTTPLSLDPNLLPLFLNDKNEIAGKISAQNGAGSFIFSQDKGMQIISNFEILSYNNNSQCLGVTTDGNFAIWQEGSFTFLNGLPFPIAKVYKINDNGQILAEAQSDQGNVFVLLSPDTMQTSENTTQLDDPATQTLTDDHTTPTQTLDITQTIIDENNQTLTNDHTTQTQIDDHTTPTQASDTTETLIN